MGQDNGNPNDNRRKPLNDPRMHGATRFEYDRFLQLVNPRHNFHAAFTRGPVYMTSVLTNQTSLALPDRQSGQGQDRDVDLNEVRPWGLAVPEDMQQGPDRQGEPRWAEALTDDSTRNILTMSAPGNTSGWENEPVLQPPPLPGNLPQTPTWAPEALGSQMQTPAPWPTSTAATSLRAPANAAATEVEDQDVMGVSS